MSENDVSYDQIAPVMEYVEKEYKKWEEQYDIPFEDEFNIRLLFQLRYDILHTKPEHTKTKKELIEAAHRIQQCLRIKPKINNKEKIVAYTDVHILPGTNHVKVTIYCRDIIYTLNDPDLSMIDYAVAIKNIFKDDDYVIFYIDTHGFGKALYDILKAEKGFDVRELKLKDYYKNLQKGTL